MSAVSPELLETIIELQSLPSLQHSFLGGGTNLAIRYNHRESVDIDLFFSGIVGKAHFLEIEREVNDFFGNRVKRLHYPCDDSDQFTFVRFWIETGDLSIKVEILQNANFLDDPEIVSGARMATVRDIGLLKLMTAANRASFKDIYDLDYVTEEVSLGQLLSYLEQKQDTFNGEAYHTIFDRDGEISPVKDPLLLLKFEEKSAARGDRPGHSDLRIITVEGSKNLMAARSSYRRKVRRLCEDLGIEFPGITSVN